MSVRLKHPERERKRDSEMVLLYQLKQQVKREKVVMANKTFPLKTIACSAFVIDALCYYICVREKGHFAPHFTKLTLKPLSYSI